MIKALSGVVLSLLIASSAFAALKPGDAAPSFTLHDGKGQEVSLSDIVGPKSTMKAKGIVLGYFATWCAPCREELHFFNAAVDELKAKGIVVVLVDMKESFDTINAMLRELKVQKPLVLSDRDGDVAEKYHIRFLPTTFFIGSDGKIKDIVFGELENGQELRERADKLLK